MVKAARCWTILGLLGLLLPVAAQEYQPTGRGSLLDDYYADTFPALVSTRVFRTEDPLSRGEFVRKVIREQLGQVPPEAFDVASMVDGMGFGSWFGRGAKLGLVTGSITYCAAELLGGDAWLLGSVGAGAGLASALFTDLDWPASLTWRSSRAATVRCEMGWVGKPGYLPRGEILPAWHTGRNRSTCGAGLNWHPDPARDDLRFDLFLDPFASERDTYGGLQFAIGF